MKMNKVMTGIGVGMAVGSMAAITGGAMMSSSKKTYRKKANKAMKSMGNMMGDMQYMFK